MRTYLLGLTLGAMLPLLAFAVAAAWWLAVEYRQAAEQGLRHTARALALALDREIAGNIAVVNALAESPLLDSDLSAFDRHARAVGAAYDSGIALHERDGRQLVNTLVPPGRPLPYSKAPDIIEEVFASARPVVTDLYVGGLGKPIVTVFAPVIRDGDVRYTIDMPLDLSRLSRLLTQQALPEGFFAFLVDGQHRVVARSHVSQELLGAAEPDWYVVGTSAEDAGILRGRALQGYDVILGFERLRRAPWTVAAAMPRAAYDANWQQPMLALIGGGLVLLALSTLSAALTARALLRPINTLTRSAQSVMEGGAPVPVPPTRVAELAMLGRTIAGAHRALQEQAATRARLATEASQRKALQQFRVMGEAVDYGVWLCGPSGSDVHHFSRSFLDLLGMTMDEVQDFGWTSRLPADDAPAIRARWQGCLERGESWEAEYRIPTSDGGFRHVLSRGRPVRDTEGRITAWAGVHLDITERKQAEERQHLLAAELDHRVRNLLTTIGAMVSVIGRTTETKEQLAAALRDRIAALARVHELVTRAPDIGVPLVQILHDELAAHAARPEAVELEGPSALSLKPKDAQSLGLVIHELATNAVKYGALSAAEGRVTVRWALEGEGDQARLRLDWRESGGPVVLPPKRRGFGSIVIETALRHEAGAEVTLDYDRAGLRCRIELPWARVVAAPSSDVKPVLVPGSEIRSARTTAVG